MRPLALLLLGFFALAAAGCGSSPKSAHVAAPRPQSGCVLHASPSGYPDSYLANVPRYTRHPPLPKSGWYTSRDPLPFPIVFHSIFHGYVVIRYSETVPPATIRLLRSWVIAHSSVRVAGTPAPPDAELPVDIAEWGHEWQCSKAAAVTPALLARVLQLRGV